MTTLSIKQKAAIRQRQLLSTYKFYIFEEVLHIAQPFL